MQRRLVAALEDLKLTSDGTVRNTVDAIVQFKYGEDGTDPSKAVRGKAIDMNDLFFEVLGEEADHLINVDVIENSGDDYGSREKDLEDGYSFTGDDSDDEMGDSDYGGSD